jgi:hypothetical protein
MTTEEQFQFVEAFNWDDPWQPVLEILASPECALETALLAFWRLDGPWHIVNAPSSVPTHMARWVSTVEQLSRDIQVGRYHAAGIGYDPIADNQLSRTQLYRLSKAGLPPVFVTRL